MSIMDVSPSKSALNMAPKSSTYTALNLTGNCSAEVVPTSNGIPSPVKETESETNGLEVSDVPENLTTNYVVPDEPTEPANTQNLTREPVSTQILAREPAEAAECPDAELLNSDVCNENNIELDAPEQSESQARSENAVSSSVAAEPSETSRSSPEQQIKKASPEPANDMNLSPVERKSSEILSVPVETKPTVIDAAPEEANIMSEKTNEKPDETKKKLAESKTTSSEKTTSTETKVNHAETKTNPLETKSIPTETKKKPTESKIKPAETKIKSAETKAKPSEPNTSKSVNEEDEEEDEDGHKPKRARLPTQPYQSPITDLQYITKIATPGKKATPKAAVEKIIAFYKNEFLAVRNPEGSFYICQTFQNIHRQSTRIKIRWFTHLPNDIFTPDFYDTTEFDCILTNVKMSRLEKDKWKLPEGERTRIESILKRALDVEKGVVDKPTVTAEHPDGLDLSLYKNEDQLSRRKKKKTVVRKTTPSKTPTPPTKKQPRRSEKSTPASTPMLPSVGKKTPRSSYLLQPTETPVTVKKKSKKDKKDKKEKKVKKEKKDKKKKHDKTVTFEVAKSWEPKSAGSSRLVLSLKKEDVLTKDTKKEESGTRSTRAADRSIATTDSVASTERTGSTTKRKAPPAASPPPAKKLAPAKKKKEEPVKVSPPSKSVPERTGKVRNAGSAVAAKINSAAMRTTKDKDRKGAANQRKK